jgi:hypothetical protein
VGTWSNHYWQRPKNQLTLLGAYARHAMLSYFDFDEYLVLPGGATLGDTKCLREPMLDAGKSGKFGSWTFTRFQAKTCAQMDSDMPCWQAGASAGSAQDIKLLHDLCPMGKDHGKQVIVADMVDSLSVHFTESQRFDGNKAVNVSCGYLLHFYSLLEGRRFGVSGLLRKLPPLVWVANTSLGRRQVWWPEGLAPLSHETCDTMKTARAAAAKAYRLAHEARLRAAPAIGLPPDQQHHKNMTVVR